MSNLYSAKAGDSYRVMSAPEAPMINTLGIYVGGVLKKKTTYSFGGPVLVDINGREVAIGRDIATNIKVESCGGTK